LKQETEGGKIFFLLLPEIAVCDAKIENKS
jgi:hypothetical protein